MTAVSRRIAAVLTAVVLGCAGAVAVADEHPILPKNLPAEAQGPGAAVSYDANDWTGFEEGTLWELTLPHPTYVRGPARIRVIAGTFIEIPPGSVVLVKWEPSVRGWSFYAERGWFRGVFPNTTTDVGPRRSITLTFAGDLFRSVTGYSSPTVTGFEGTPEVSGFQTTAVIRR